MANIGWTKDWPIEEDDDNMIVKLEQQRLLTTFLSDLESKVSIIEDIVSYHFTTLFHRHCTITVSKRTQWIYGSFNVCIPVTVGVSQDRWIIRCPFPFMLGRQVEEVCQDGPVEEKLRAEAATYAWISANCSHIPIPHLRGFGLPNGMRFTPMVHASWISRFFESCKNQWSRFFGILRDVPFVSATMAPSLPSGYLLISHVEGTMLSSLPLPSSEKHKLNLYTSLARSMIDLTRMPLPSIGSLTIKNTGESRLENRPLTKHLALMESEGIPVVISRDRLYNHTEAYYADLLRCLDLKLKHQPNSIRDRDDGISQMSVNIMLRAVQTDFIDQENSHGPFYMTFTDLHQSNLFVDADYNIISIIDLEWCCSLPLASSKLPFWLTGMGVDDCCTPERKNTLYKEWHLFIDVLEQQEKENTDNNKLSLAMKKSLKFSTQWYIACLMVPRATYNLFTDHILPVFAKEDPIEDEAVFHQATSKFWGREVQDLLSLKVEHYQSYCQELRLQSERCVQ